jgi:DNA-binding transcriptional LysR family regulator
MQLELLAVLQAVARHGSITRAAVALGYTQSAVSRQIAVLETEVGARLFDRRPRGVALTVEGECLLAHAEAIVDRMAVARQDLDALGGLGGGRLRIGAFPTAVAALVPRALSAFRDAHPSVTVSLVEGRTPALLERLVSGDADVAVVSAPPGDPIDTGRFALHHLLDERLLVAVPRDHPLAARRTVRLAELADDPFVVGSAIADFALMRASFPRGFQPRVEMAVADWTGKLGCVAAGLGVALMPALAIRAAPPDIVLLRLNVADASIRRVFAATVVGRSRSAAVTRFVAYLDGVAAQLDREPAT